MKLKHKIPVDLLIVIVGVLFVPDQVSAGALTQAQINAIAGSVTGQGEQQQGGDGIEYTPDTPPAENPNDYFDSDPGEVLHGFFSKRPGDEGYENGLYEDGHGDTE